MRKGDSGFSYSETEIEIMEIEKKILSSKKIGGSEYLKLKELLDEELRTIKSYRKHGHAGHNNIFEERCRKALSYARDSLNIAASIGSSELGSMSIELIAEINPELISGNCEWSKWVNHKMKIINEKDLLVEFHKYGFENEMKTLHPSKSATIVASICGILIGAILMGGGITGNTISGMSQDSSNAIGIVMFVLSLFGMIILSRNGSK